MCCLFQLELRAVGGGCYSRPSSGLCKFVSKNVLGLFWFKIYLIREKLTLFGLKRSEYLYFSIQNFSLTVASNLKKKKTLISFPSIYFYSKQNKFNRSTVISGRMSPPICTFSVEDNRIVA